MQQYIVLHESNVNNFHGYLMYIIALPTVLL